MASDPVVLFRKFIARHVFATPNFRLYANNNKIDQQCLLISFTSHILHILINVMSWTCEIRLIDRNSKCFTYLKAPLNMPRLQDIFHLSHNLPWTVEVLIWKWQLEGNGYPDYIQCKTNNAKRNLSCYLHKAIIPH